MLIGRIHRRGLRDTPAFDVHSDGRFTLFRDMRHDAQFG